MWLYQGNTGLESEMEIKQKQVQGHWGCCSLTVTYLPQDDLCLWMAVSVWWCHTWYTENQGRFLRTLMKGLTPSHMSFFFFFFFSSSPLNFLLLLWSTLVWGIYSDTSLHPLQYTSCLLIMCFCTSFFSFSTCSSSVSYTHLTLPTKTRV